MTLIEGARGSGKDVTAHQVVRDLRENDRIVYINLEPRKYNLPHYFRRWDRKFHENSIIYLTDAHLEYYATEWGTDKAKTLTKLQNISRHKNIDMVWTTLLATDVPKNFIRRLDCSIYKEPVFRAEKFERQELREEIEYARKFFETKPEGWQGTFQRWKWGHAVAYTQYGYFEIEGIEKPYYWSEELSKAHAGLDLEPKQEKPAIIRIKKT